MLYTTQTTGELLQTITENSTQINNAAVGVRLDTQDEKLQDEMYGIEEKTEAIARAAQSLQEKIEALEYELGQRR